MLSYHVWKDMAPLKPFFHLHIFLFKLVLTMSEKTWLHWSIGITMNPSVRITLTMSEKTWLHWSAIDYDLLKKSESSYHVWKDMAPLKRQYIRLPIIFWPNLPCLKRHGSIEATRNQKCTDTHYWLTMSEKTWLHWSWISLSKSVSADSLTMSEKTWLHWSSDIQLMF